ncbi:lysozyme [Streptomyces sp. SID3212]|uniref:lysozyme n=1 Tax=Streptomyces sp. SID3212 TaxID=2690259 RepID=UPI00136D157A|nr:lysozyme [Streptomyces sp. SID3212]MYV55980.1 lysozyme [Streptomyces sp. SID3212]
MPTPGPTTTGRLLRSTAATLLAVPALLLTFPPTSTAAPAAPASVPPVRGSAHMGLGVLTHEGRGGGAPASLRVAQTEGVDVSSHQKDVDWAKLWDSGVKWAYVKATEGSYYKNPYFGQQYEGSYNTGMIRGAYHFAAPDDSGGAEQATYFVDGGGAWSPDGRTLPGVLDIEWNPYGAACYGKTPAQLVSWIRDFLTTYKTRTGRAALIYTSTNWWRDCTGNYAGFGPTNPLWIARYDKTVGELPAGWEYQTIWQYTSSGPTVGDHNKFNGPLSGVKSLATG